MSTSREDFFNTGRTMASFIERGTCDCVIEALMMSVIIWVSISMHWVNTHEGRGSRAHVFFVFFSISDTSFTPTIFNLQR